MLAGSHVVAEAPSGAAEEWLTPLSSSPSRANHSIRRYVREYPNNDLGPDFLARPVPNGKFVFKTVHIDL